ncbi:MAG TPA: CBS domain-containing protein [Actinomycetota bacterium]
MADRARQAGFDTAIAINENRAVFGILRDKHLAKDPDLTVKEAMSAGPSTFRLSVDPSELAQLMIDHDLPNVPITTNGGVLVGLLLREDAARAALEAHRHHEHEHDG